MTDSISNSSSREFNPPFASYTEFVELLARRQPQYAWLSYFFSHIPDDQGHHTNMFVVDSEDRHLIQKSIAPEQLQQCSSSVQTRLVLIDYKDTWTIGRGLLDWVSFVLDLPPYYLWQHFDYKHNDLECSNPNSERIYMGLKREAISPSQIISPEIGDNHFTQFPFLLITASEARPAPIG